MTRHIQEHKNRVLYNLLLPLGIGFYYLYAILFKKKRIDALRLRLGRISKEQLTRLAGRKPIWIQAVSVGEVASVRPLIELLHREIPQIPIILTTTTNKGMEVASRFEIHNLLVVYFPLDFPWTMQRFIEQTNPRLFLMVETELWPNCIAQLAQKKIHMGIINGRISDKSFPRYQTFRKVIQQFLAPVEFFLMQSDTDVYRLEQIGVPKEKIQVMGNLKFDAAGIASKESSLPLPTFLKKGPIWMAASTHDPEEKQLYTIYQQLKKSHPSLCWIVAPRHLERADALENWFLQQGEKVVRWTRYRENACNGSVPILIIDTIGELSRFYAIADIVFIGGSLISHGGQNPLEAACFGKPILTGPYMFNFRDIMAYLLESGGIFQAHNLVELEETVASLLQNPTEAKKMGENAHRVVDQHQGASRRVLEFLKNLLADN